MLLCVHVVAISQPNVATDIEINENGIKFMGSNSHIPSAQWPYVASGQHRDRTFLSAQKELSHSTALKGQSRTRQLWAINSLEKT